MKRLFYILVFLPVLAFGQYDFETRYFTMDANSLPEMPEISSFDLDFGQAGTFRKKHITDFNKVTVKNYWQPVDMMLALTEESSLVDYPKVNLPRLNEKEFGFSFSVNGNNSFDGTSGYRVRNTVYKEARSIYFCSPPGIYSGYYLGRRNRY